MITFRLTTSPMFGVQIVEVWWDNEHIATIGGPPPGSNLAGIGIVSESINEVTRDSQGVAESIAILFDV